MDEDTQAWRGYVTCPRSKAMGGKAFVLNDRSTLPPILIPTMLVFEPEPESGCFLSVWPQARALTPLSIRDARN